MTWTSPGQCSTCKFCAMDMDMAPFCVQAQVVKQHPHGLNLDAAIKGFCGEELKLREPRSPAATRHR